jgi:hypothetical protein
MTLKPMTYLISFTLFVMLFLGLGVYVGYSKIVDHLLAQSFLEATSINASVLVDQQGRELRWEGKISLQQGVVARIVASNRSTPISIHYSDGPGPTRQSHPTADAIHLSANERTEDLRIDKANHYLYARVLASSDIKSKETTWLCKYDLQGRRILRRTSVNPIMLPTPFKP